MIRTSEGGDIQSITTQFSGTWNPNTAVRLVYHENDHTGKWFLTLGYRC